MVFLLQMYRFPVIDVSAVPMTILSIYALSIYDDVFFFALDDSRDLRGGDFQCC